MTLRAAILQHVPFEGPGSIETWLRERGADLGIVRLYANAPLPPLDAFDLLVIMGGPMSVNDEEKYPWLKDEKALLRAAIDQGKAILGICLGAQLLASALGARVFPNRHKEIGWFPIQKTAPAEPAAVFAFPDTTTVFHWHGETFNLPDGAHQLARSEACDQQAFQYGRCVIGLQFHLEMTPQTLLTMLSHAGDELRPAPWIQSAEAIATIPPETFSRNYNLLSSILAYLTPPR